MYAYTARERMPADRISIVMRGVAAKAGFILTFGNVWGEDSIVRATSLRDSRIDLRRGGDVGA
jgi:hypothetical protein